MLQDYNGLKLGSHFNLPQTSWLTVPSKIQTMVFRLVLNAQEERAVGIWGRITCATIALIEQARLARIQCASNHRDLAEAKT